MPLTTNLALYPSLHYDTLRDFVPILLTGENGLVVVANPAVPVKTFSDLIALAKKQPNALAAGTSGNGTTAHIALAQINKRAGVSITHVPYNGGVPSLTAAMSGEVQVTLTDQVPWSIQIGGGAANLRLDLRHAKLSKLEISGGANRLDAQLPSPKGTVLISVSGGANNVTMVAPAHAPWRVAVSGGVSAVTINGSSSGSLGGDFQQQSPDYGSATDRFDVEISGGASHVNFRSS